MSNHILTEEQYKQYKELLSAASSLYTNLKFLIMTKSTADMDFIKGIANHLETILEETDKEKNK